ncbi:hypothetical protein DUI87_18902 [Hirundo rustica rustica]|uniref:Reverse transcriptase domain-containing protein n=1 Tax=Hirundo rustica rustica TaxID=333673 RepID=A0A3M0JU45_HIRRU|nr:hypothetical protein DUI87_18902 [Hirundo rustica rustica]
MDHTQWIHDANEMLQLTVEVTHLVDAGRAVDVVCLDFSKAFDTVSHGTLLEKLAAHGLDRSTLCWVRNGLVGQAQRVVVNGAASSWGSVPSSVPQGSVLDPALFGVFSDGPNGGDWVCPSKLADDTELGVSVGQLEARRALQRDLARLDRWAESNNVRFNKTKRQVLHFGPSNRCSAAGWGRVAGQCPGRKDLGVLVTVTGHEPGCAQGAKKGNGILAWISNGVASRSRAGIVPLCWALLDHILSPPPMPFRKSSSPEVSSGLGRSPKFKRQLSEDGRQLRRGSLGGALTGKYLLPSATGQQLWQPIETTNLVRMRYQTLGQSAPSLTASLFLKYFVLMRT